MSIKIREEIEMRGGGGGGEAGIRVRPFCLKIFFAYLRNKANLDPFHMCFACSL